MNDKTDEIREKQIRYMSDYASEIAVRLPRYYHLNELFERTSKDAIWFSLSKGQYQVEFKVNTDPYTLRGELLRKLYNEIVLRCVALEEFHVRRKLDEGFRNPTINVKERK